MASNRITFLSVFVKIGEVVLKLKGGHADRTLISYVQFVNSSASGE